MHNAERQKEAKERGEREGTSATAAAAAAAAPRGRPKSVFALNPNVTRNLEQVRYFRLVCVMCMGFCIGGSCVCVVVRYFFD